ncbi:MAG: phosphomannomutase [Methanobacteriaceae archaeon]|nr:phosphomannomutase [Methanobacteriaceae archaeon]MDP2836296.1 phosphomannomutase [Methanobacteriaceae archaeon]MDP3033719.1 phosphomannomutase [Methanobacteriaceae archaeon]MDP3484011.1 phosphomannomutase [Methanobacteriaceae archaeon]MDP3624286.1 phosphomannomutase [Methanobacteriaceae archaeon]
MAKYVQDIRGVVNAEISNKFASHLGTIIGNYLGCGQYVLVGRDFYTPSQMIKRSITTGLMSSGINVMDFGVAPIPVIHSNMDFYNASVMISISRSHLRPEDVNIKIISDHEIPLEQRPGEKVSWKEIGELNYVHDYRDRYINAVVEKAPKELIEEKGFLLVLDCEEGLNKPFAPDILHKMDCQTILIGCKDTQLEFSFPEPNPQRISLVSELITAIGADMGIILDNDQDMVVFIDEKGNRIRDQTILGIFSKYILEENPRSTIVSSVVVSKSLDEIISKKEGKLIKTSVNQVLSGIVEEDAIFGGDEPGMFVFPEFQLCFDAIFAVVKMLEILAKNDTTLSNLAGEIKQYSRTVFTIDCEHEKKAQIIDIFKDNFESKYEINTLDGIRVDLDDSLILIRPSRFEPLIRVYLESKSAEKLQELSETVKSMIEMVQ